MQCIKHLRVVSGRLNVLVTKKRIGRSTALRLAASAAVCVGAALPAVYAQTAQFSYAIQTLGGALTYPTAVAVDSSGNVYVADTQVTQVAKIPPGCTSASCETRIGVDEFGFDLEGVAVDGSGNLYVADTDNNVVDELPPSCTSLSCATVLGGGFSNPRGIAVDGSGNVYVADSGNHAVKKMPAGCTSSSCVTTLGGGFDVPFGVALDSSGNVYVGDEGNNAVTEMPPSCVSSSCVTTLGGGFNGPTGIAVDLSGNIYVADLNNSAVKEMPAGCTSSSCVTPLGEGFLLPEGVAVDGSGNVYVADTHNNALKEVMRRGVDLASSPVGQSSESPALTFTFSASGTIAAPVVLTAGATGLDFTDAGTGTCTTNATAHTYAPGDTCTIVVKFSPTVPGLRSGAVELTTTAGTVIATAYLYGTGTGPQVIFNPGTASTLGGAYTFISPEGVAVDGSGNVYIADTSFNVVREIPPGCASSSCVASLGGGFDLITSVAVDGAGNVYVADNSGNAVKEMPPGCASSNCVTTLGGGFKFPDGVAVDGAGNVYVADAGDEAVKEMPPGCMSSNCVITLGGTLFPQSIAVDSSGNVYVAGGNVVEMPPGCTSSSCETTLGVGGGALNASGIAVDASGNVYFSDTSNNGVKEMPPGCMSLSCIATLPGGFTSPFGLALDGGGNVYVTNYLLSQINAVMKLDRADPPSLTFAATAVGSTSSDSPQTVTLANIGNEALTFPAPTSGQNPSLSAGFSLDSTSTCPVLSSSSAPATLASSSTCTLLVSFRPKSPGIISESLAVTDNNLNVAAATQTIALSGTGTGVNTPEVTVNSLSIAYLASATQLTASIAYTGSTAPTGAVTFTLAGATFTGICTGASSVRNCSVIVPTLGLAVGTYPITVSEAADSNFPPAAGTGTLTVNSQTPTVTVSSLSVVQGTTTTQLAASIAYTGSTAPSGAVTFTLTGVNGANYTGTCAVVASIRSCSATANTSTLEVGSYTIAVNEAADADYPTAGALGTLTITLVPMQTPKVILPSQIVFQSSETVTATITFTGSTAPVGAVAFFVDSTQYGANCTVTAPVRSCSTSLGSILGPGVYTVFVQEAADLNFVAVSAQGTLTVTNGAQTPVITVGSPSIVQGTSTAKLTASFAYVGSTAPTGAVSFAFNGVNYVGACTVASSVRSCSVIVPTSSLAPGGYLIAVSEAADANFLATSGETFLTVTPSAANVPTVAVTSMSVVQGISSANLTASITYTGSTAPTGAVTFSLNGTGYTGICTVAASVRSCSATATTSTLAQGNYAIMVNEAADTNYASASGTGTLTVTSAAQTPKLTVGSLRIVQGTGTANLTASIAYNGSTAPTGAVTFKLNGANYAATCTATSSVRSCSATANTSPLPQGNYAITVTEAADANYASASGTGTLTVARAPLIPTILVNTVNIVQRTSTANLTASIDYTGSTAPTGAVIFTFNGANYVGTCSTPPDVRSCSATVSTLSLAAGTYPIMVTETPDLIFASATATGTLTVTSKTALTPKVTVPSRTLAEWQGTEKFIASIAYTGSTAPTGAVTFTVQGATLLPVPYPATCITVSSVRSCSALIGALVPGGYTITVREAADTNYTAASAAGTLIVTPAPTFKLIATPSFETIRRGELAVFRLEVQSLHGFSDVVKLSCSGGPSDSVCQNFSRTVKLEPNKPVQAISGIRFPKDTPRGTYTLTFTGNSCGMVFTTTARFKVED